MSNYPVTIPEYTTVTIETLDPVKVKAESPSNIYISLEHEGSERRLETKNRMEKTLGIDCYGMYQKGKGVHEETKSIIGDKIKEKVDSWPSESEEKPNETKRENEIKDIPELVFEKTEGSYSIKSEFEEAKVSITYTENKITGKFEDIKYDVTVKLKVTVTDTRDDQMFPIYDGEEITFSPLSMVFVFEESYTG